MTSTHNPITGTQPPIAPVGVSWQSARFSWVGGFAISRRNRMRPSQYQLLPALTPNEYDSLKADILERGVQVPVEYDEDGNILDGHHRVQICTLLGISEWPCVVRLNMSEEAKVEHILALNLDRRHLSREQRQELVVSLRERGWSIRRIANRLNIAPNTVVADTQVYQFDTPDTVTGADGKAYPASQPRKRKEATVECPGCHLDFATWSPADDPPDDEWDYWQCSECGYVRRGERSLLYRPISLFNPSPRDIVKARAVLDDGDEELIAEMDNSGKVDGAYNAMRRQEQLAAIKDSPLPEGIYRVFYADPPWDYAQVIDKYGPAQRHYATMKQDEICAIGEEVKARTADNAVLFLWSTSPKLKDALDVISAWGFRYTGAMFVWDKVKHNYGHYNSVRHELLLIAVKGSCTPDEVKLFDSVQTIDRSDEHSEKPEEFRKIIDTLYPLGGRIELFARKATEGWERWGAEA